MTKEISNRLVVAAASIVTVAATVYALAAPFTE